ncbi:hypothetical protein PHMEG_0004306 [Phytophthora megakarya]|uniref:Tubby C-terminal domain-containing protein n=1 Tax=Phytophthora megakarya TaxID=4795 RepID=A0A225WU96_9STRA|nr:hypothetical protein PHMEG_0004306 [Phytophthora megakarya]
MARHQSQQATYDQMMAELQLDSDEDEREAKYHDSWQSRKKGYDVESRHQKPEEKPGGWFDKEDQRIEAKTSDIEAKDTESKKLSFKSSDGKISRSSFTPVINVNCAVFGAANANLTSEGLCRTPQRAEISALRSFVMRSPTQGAAAIRCYVERDRQGLNRLHPIFRLYLESGKQFLLCAQKRASSKTSNYLLAMEQTPTNRRSNFIVGKLRSNWSGSEYTMYDDGMSPSKTALEASVRNILCAVEFSYDDMGPGRLAVQIPHVQSNGTASTWKDKSPKVGSTDNEKLLMLHNKRPHFDEKTGGHVLDFGGRVTMPSIKNFQMICDVRSSLFITNSQFRH